MIVNGANLALLFQGFKTAFQDGLGLAPSQWDRVATRIPSTTAEEKYGWLGKVPGMREWIGERVIHSLAQHDYSIRNKDWEDTIAVDRNHIEDDQYGIYAPMFRALGEAVAAHPNQLVFNLLKAGFDTVCYDGQYFFDTDHPVLDANGVVQSVSNSGGGDGTPWFLVDASRALKPIIYQVRKEAALTRMDADTDEAVFTRREFRYGVHARCNVGYGLWQIAYGSKQTLNATAYNNAYAALQGMKGDYGRPLGLQPNLLIVPPTLRAKALEIVKAERDAAGATNINRDTADVLVVSWLA